MLAYSNEARKSHIENIEKLIVKVGNVSGEHLSYIEATEITNYLNMLKKEYEKEMTK